MSRSKVDSEKSLRDLQSEEAFRRKIAAEELGKLATSNEPIASALLFIWESDSNQYVRQAAKKALLAPAHLAILQQRPDWAAKVTMLQSETPSSIQRPQSEVQKTMASSTKFTMLLGLVLIIVGAVPSLYSYAEASRRAAFIGFATYTVYWVPILLGIILLVMGFLRRTEKSQVSSTTAPVPTPTPASQEDQTLRKLKEMLDAGLITEQDYETKRADILSKPKAT
jgi:hypothetical protein